MTGAEISATADELLRSAGAVVFNFSSNRALPKSLRGLPDKLCFYRGVTYLIEIKGDGDDLRPEQMKFYQMVAPHLSHHLRYILADNLDVFTLLVEGGCRMVEVPEKWLDKLV